MYILKECSRTQCIWEILCDPSQMHNTFNLDLKAWMKTNVMSKAMWFAKIAWNCLFLHVGIPGNGATTKFFK